MTPLHPVVEFRNAFIDVKEIRAHRFWFDRTPEKCK